MSDIGAPQDDSGPGAPRAHGRVPAVSVVLYVHNGEDGLGRSIDSILGQTMSDLELCILDDGSTDRTADVIRGYPDPRIRSASQAALGPARLHDTFNRVLGMARAPLVAIANADDVWRPDKLARQVEAFDDHPDLDVCFHDVSFMDERGRVTIGGYRTNQPWVIDDLDVAEFFSGDPIPNPTVMFRQEIVRVIGLQEVGWVHDYQFWMKAALGRCTFLGLPDRLVVYRSDGGTSTAATNRDRILAASLQTIESMRRGHDLTDIFPDLLCCDDGAESVAYAHLELANRFLNNRQIDLARWELELLLAVRPDCCAALNNLAICLAAAGEAARARALLDLAAAIGDCPAASHNAAAFRNGGGDVELLVAEWTGQLPALARRRGRGPRPVRAKAPAAATVVGLAADADLDPAFGVLAEIADGRAVPFPVLFVTESAASTAALSERYDQLAIPEPPPGEPPSVEALQVLPCNHRSVVAAHLMTARRIVIPVGGARARALASFVDQAAGAEAAGPGPEAPDARSQPGPATAARLGVAAG